MIEPTRIGLPLIEAISAPRPYGTTGVWPLGQAGLIVAIGDAMIAIDLYLSNHCEAAVRRPFDHRRLTRAPLDASELVNLSAVLCSHFHLDHFDVPTIRTVRDSSPQAVLVLPEAARAAALALDWPEQRVMGTTGAESVTIAAATITSFGVPHEEYLIEPGQGHVFQGFAISADQTTIAHVGDARAGARLAELLKEIQPDLLCLPINGRSDERSAMGFAGNMNAEEAVELAVAAGVQRVLPMHDDMFAQNIDPNARARFFKAAAAADIEVVRPPVGEPYFLRTDL